MKTRAFYLIIFTLFAGKTFGFALGEVEINSYFDEPLNARLPLIQLHEEELDSIKIDLANKFAFASAGINRNKSLRDLQFDLKRSTTQGHYIHITSDKSIRELYLDFIVDISIEGKRVSKNVTLLLDPRNYASIPRLTVRKESRPPTKSPLIVKQKTSQSMESHSMEASIDHGDSHSMESHSMEASIDHGESHSMESHSMEASIDHGESHSMESHSMEASIDHGESHSMESHSMEASIDHGDSHSMESHSMESNVDHGDSHSMESHSMESNVDHGDSHSMESSSSL